MPTIKRYARPISYLLIIALTMLSLPHHRARAATVGTGAVTKAQSAVSAKSLSSDRAPGEALGQREKAFAQLEEDEVSADEAQTWEESLTDDEVAMGADDSGQLAAGEDEISAREVFGGFLAVIAIGALVLFSVALLTFP